MHCLNPYITSCWAEFSYAMVKAIGDGEMEIVKKNLNKALLFHS